MASFRHVYHRDGSESFFIDGAKVSKRRYNRALPDKPIRAGADLPVGWHTPVLSDALAVHPRQIPEAMARDKLHGLNIEYLPDGRPKITSQAQKRALIKSLGLHENNCYS